MFDSLRKASPVLLSLLVVMLMSAVCASPAAPGEPGDTGDTGDTGGEELHTPTATAVPVPTATEVPQTPPGDCWDGVLAEDGVHCYVLEEAQRQGAIKVVAIYEAPNDVLHVFLARSDPLDRELTSLFRRKASALLSERLESLSALAFRWDMVGGGEFRGLLVPPSMEGYVQAFLHVGGLKAVTSQPGWASWDAAVAGRVDGAQARPGLRARFDVSDIDTANIPEPDCEVEADDSGCEDWKLYPDSGIAGYHRDPDRRPGEDKKRGYVQVKETLLPTDEEGKQALLRKLGLDRFQTHEEIELVPVKV